MDEMGSISIPRDDFDTLIRRAELHRDDGNYVTILKSDHDDLLRASREYEALRTALIAGGLAPDDLDILIATPVDSLPKQHENWSAARVRKWSADAAVFVPKTNRAHSTFKSRKHDMYCNEIPSSRTVPPTPPPLSSDLEIEERQQDEEAEQCYTEEVLYENNHKDRSIVLRGLSAFTTLADIANVIRGGHVLNMFLRSRDRTAHVSFVDAIAAEKFIIHSKRSDLYIKGKRMEVYWDDRQHYLPAHIARRIHSGATRNIVVRFVKPDITIETIRDHLEHIHRLEIVDIVHKDGHAFISLNGINAAVTARNCMSSRLKYKGSRIEFYPDECNQPLPPVVKKHYVRPAPKKAATVSRMNRFALLLEDGSEEFEEAHMGGARRNASAGDVGL